MAGFTGDQLRNFAIWAFATLVSAWVAGKVATAIAKEAK
jgi:hypothetical protein